MKSYMKLAAGASLMALMTLGCSTAVPQAQDAAVAQNDECHVSSAGLRPQWTDAQTVASRGELENWRPNARQPHQPTAVNTASVWRPDIKTQQQSYAVASCSKPVDSRTY